MQSRDWMLHVVGSSPRLKILRACLTHGELSIHKLRGYTGIGALSSIRYHAELLVRAGLLLRVKRLIPFPRGKRLQYYRWMGTKLLYRVNLEHRLMPTIQTFLGYRDTLSLPSNYKHPAPLVNPTSPLQFRGSPLRFRGSSP